jgi:Mrp family chromosome partitioning ATPase
VIVDTPAIVPQTDAAIVAEKTDGALLVVRLGATPRETVALGLDRLTKARVNVLGTVLTHLTPDLKDYYYSALN